MIGFLKSIKRRDPAAKNMLHILLLYPGVWAIFFHRIAHFLSKIKLSFFARLISQISRLLTLIEIHPDAIIGKNCFIDHGCGVVIGQTTVIGDNCTIYQGVTLGATRFEKVKRHPSLMDDVVVGAGALVLGNICLGKGCKIGAGAVVVKDVDEGQTILAYLGKVKSAEENF